MRNVICHLALWIGLCQAALHAADAGTAQSPSEAQPADDRRTLVDPTILLIRNDSVRSELGLSESQRHSLDELLRKHNRALLAIRDVSPSGANESVKPALDEVRRELPQLLRTEQRTRLMNIMLQVQGYSGLLRKDVSTQLQLTASQQQELQRVFEETRTAMNELRAAQTPGASDGAGEKLAELQKKQQQRVLGILNKDQVTKFATLLGAPFDLSKAAPSPANAPEFDASNTWLNSEPLTMESLRGKVVVVHFFAFGCINCVHNYPWYKDWQANLTSKGVVLIGIHTPETAQEAKRELLEASLMSNGLEFPVVIDNEKKMWQAWSNSIWPSVYIIDKKGRLRYWWYGELDWQGAGNQKVARRQIEQLLTEE